MSKGLLVALSLFAVSAAKAVMVTWSVPAWDSSFLQTENVDVYLVTSGTSDSDPSASWKSTGSWGVDRDVNSGNTVKQLTASEGQSNYGTIVDGRARIYADVGDLTTGYTYSLVFAIKSGDQTDHYAMTSGVKYGSITDKGFYNPVVEGKEPDLLNFLDVNWSASNNVRGTPEPTALALLAFGVAGLALRRRVRF